MSEQMIVTACVVANKPITEREELVAELTAVLEKFDLTLVGSVVVEDDFLAGSLQGQENDPGEVRMGFTGSFPPD